MKKIIIFLLIFLVNRSYLVAQNTRIHFKSNTVVYLMKGNEVVDSIEIYNFIKGIEFMNRLNDKMYECQVVIPSPGENFKDNFFIISEYIISDNKFVSTHTLKITKNDCYRKISSFKIRKKGIVWKYQKGLFRKKGGIITFEDFNRLKEYGLKCD